jgi:hypothetical protein
MTIQQLRNIVARNWHKCKTPAPVRAEWKGYLDYLEELDNRLKKVEEGMK